jgi:hypothetical protein
MNRLNDVVIKFGNFSGLKSGRIRSNHKDFLFTWGFRSFRVIDPSKALPNITGEFNIWGEDAVHPLTEGYVRVVDLLEKEIFLKTTGCKCPPPTLPEVRWRGRGWRYPDPAGSKAPASQQRGMMSAATEAAAAVAAAAVAVAAAVAAVAAALATTTMAVAEATTPEVAAAWESSSLPVADIRGEAATVAVIM